QKAQDTNEAPLEEWEAREPDNLNYAESIEPGKKYKERGHTKVETEGIEPQAIEIAESIKKPVFTEDLSINEENNIAVDSEQKQVSGTKTYSSVPEYAEDLMAQKLNIPDSAKDQMAIVLAKRITTKASELLGAEYTTESTGSSGDESLTYTLR